jgi:MFS family permease
MSATPNPHVSLCAVPGGPASRAVTLAVAGAATLLVLVVFTTVITTVGATASSFHASVSWQTWALSGMSLGLATWLLPAGALADRAGHRLVFALSSAALAVFTALGAAAPSMAVFVSARVLQGAAGAGMLAAGLGVIGAAFPQGPSRTHATGVWGAMLAAGIALGPVLGAALMLPGTWRTSYWAEALAAAAVAWAARALPGPRPHGRPRRLDPPGASAMAIAMGSLTAGLTSGRLSWTSPTTITLLAGGAAALVAFTAIEARRSEPMLDLRLFRQPLFAASMSGAAITGLATVALMSYAPTLLERGLHGTALSAGGVLAIWSVTSMLVSMQARRIPARIHARGRLIAGLVTSGFGAAALSWLPATASWARLAPGLAIAGIGSGLANAALARLAVESVPRSDAALGSGSNNTARYLGSAIGIALVVAIVSTGGSGTAGLVTGWNRAALTAALINLAGAVLVAASRGYRLPPRHRSLPGKTRARNQDAGRHAADTAQSTGTNQSGIAAPGMRQPAPARFIERSMRGQAPLLHWPDSRPRVR